MAENRKPKIIVDNREPEEVCDALESMGAELELRQLELADYQVSERLGVERKTRSDFESSIVDGRLFSQAADLSKSFQRVAVIVEGEPGGFESRLNRAALLGAYSSLISDYGCALFFTRSPYATAELVHALAKHEQLSKSQPNSVYAKRKARTLHEQQRAIVESLPSVGPTLAGQLLGYFQTVENVMSAPESELREVGKIGEKKARQLREVLSSRYKSDE